MQPLNQPLQPNPLILPEPKHSLQKIFDFLSYGKAYFWGTYDQTKDVDTRYNWVTHQLKMLNKERGESSFWIQWNTQGHQVYLEIQKEIEALCPLNLRDLSSSEKDMDAIKQLVTRDQALKHLDAIQEKVGEVQGDLDKLNNKSLEPSWPQWLLKHLSAIREIEEKIQSLEPLQKFFVIGERGAIEEIPGVDVESVKKRLSHTLFQMAEKHFVAFVENSYRSYYQQVQEKIVHLQQDRAIYLKSWTHYAWSFWGNYWEKEHPEDASFLRGRVDYLKTLHLATALPRLKNFREEVNSPESLRIQFEDLFPSQIEGSITKICRVVKALYSLSNLPSLPFPQGWEEHRHIGVGLGDTPSALATQLLFSDPFLARFAVEGEGQSQEIKQLYKEYLRADWNYHWVSWQEFIRDSSNEDTFWLNPHASFKKREPFKLNPLQLQNSPQTAQAALEEVISHLDSTSNPLFHTLVTRKLGCTEKQEAQQAIIDLEWTAPDQSQDPEETPSYLPQTLELLLEEKFCLTHPQEGKEFTQFSKFPEVLLIHLSKSSRTKKEPFGIMEHLYLNSDFSSETSSGACYELVSFLVDKTHYRKTGFGYFSIQNDVIESISREVFLENAKASTAAVFRRSSESFTAEEIHTQTTQNLYRFYIDLYRPLTIEAALGRNRYIVPDNQQRGMQCLTSFVSSLVCTPSFPRKQIGLFPRNPNDLIEYTFNELPTPFQQFLWDVWKPSSQSSQQPNPSFLQDIRSKLLLQADELPLDIPPHPDEQKYDKDGFVLTLLADRLFKYLQKHPEKILHDPMQKTLYLATHHAIAQVAAARRIQKIRLSVLIEETVQITTTLVLAPFTKNKKSHLRQQAISTTSRVFSILVDPLQESPRLQKIMQMGTSVVLCGESLDDPDLSEKDKDNMAALFFAKSIFSHAPGSILPAIPEKHRHLYDSTTDIALTLSTAYLKETPAPIVSWAASYTLRRLDRSLVLPLSPDTPQSTYNFYAARIISPVLSNSTLHTLTAEKTLKAIQDLTKRPPSPKFSESLDPEEQAKYPKQEPTEEALRLQAEYEQLLSEYERLKKEEQTKYDLELAEYERQLQNKISHKETAVNQAEKEMIKYWNRYNKAKGVFSSGDKEFNKYWKKRETYKTLSGELNALKSQQGLPQEHPFEKFIKKPSPPKGILGALDKAYDKTSKFLGKIGFSTAGAPNGAVNIGTISSPEMNRARGEPTLFHHDLRGDSTRAQPSSPYWETRHQIAMDRAGLQGVASKPIQAPQQPKPNTAQNWGWQGVESMQQQQLFDRNMAYQSPVNNSPQTSIDYHSMQSPGMSSTAQFPPTDFSGLGRTATNVVALRPSYDRPLQMAGFLPFVISKVVPEQTKIKVETWVKSYIQQWKDDPLQARKDLDICLILGAKKGLLIAIQAFEQPSLKTRPNTFGLMEVSDRFDNWFAQKVNIDLTSPNAQMGMFVGEFAMPIPMLGAFKHCTKVGQEAFAFMRQSAKLMKPNPLLDRALAFPQGFGQQVRAIEALQQPVYRSGFASEKAIQQARKAVNMPSWRKIEIDVEHAVSGHMSGGWRTGCKNHNKTLFPEGFSEKQVEKVIRQAYRNGKKVKTQGNKAVIIGEEQGVKIKMHVDIKQKIIESAYPIK